MQSPSRCRSQRSQREWNPVVSFKVPYLSQNPPRPPPPFRCALMFLLENKRLVNRHRYGIDTAIIICIISLFMYIISFYYFVGCSILRFVMVEDTKSQWMWFFWMTIKQFETLISFPNEDISPSNPIGIPKCKFGRHLSSSSASLQPSLKCFY